MGISRFFEETLGARLRNQRTSWGAQSPVNGHVYLRVWKDQIETNSGKEYVRIGYARPRQRSPGFAERNRHIDLIRSGAEGFGVVCEAVDPDTPAARKIRSFDSRELVRLGTLSVRGGDIYAAVIERVPVAEAVVGEMRASELVADLRAIERRSLGPTQKKALVDARIGQGRFRADLLQRWGDRCAVTGSSVPDAIRASHIKPWRHSDDRERLDPANGLPLIATLDALFDAGLISFDEHGGMLVSSKLSEEERNILLSRCQKLRMSVPDDMVKYLEFHKNQLFRA